MCELDPTQVFPYGEHVERRLRKQTSGGGRTTRFAGVLCVVFRELGCSELAVSTRCSTLACTDESHQAHAAHENNAKQGSADNKLEVHKQTGGLQTNWGDHHHHGHKKQRVTPRLTGTIWPVVGDTNIPPSGVPLGKIGLNPTPATEAVVASAPAERAAGAATRPPA